MGTRKKMGYLILLGLTLVVLGVVGSLAFAGYRSASMTPVTGLIDGWLQPCGGKMNCVCSENEQGPAHIAPLTFDGEPREAWERLKVAVNQLDGHIEQDDGTYLHATFRSRLFRFVDDLECRLDTEQGLIHVRSASRVGYSDLGVNRRRVEQLRARFQSLV